MLFKMIEVLSCLLGPCHLLVWLTRSDSQVQLEGAEIKQLEAALTKECGGKDNWWLWKRDTVFKRSCL